MPTIVVYRLTETPEHLGPPIWYLTEHEALDAIDELVDVGEVLQEVPADHGRAWQAGPVTFRLDRLEVAPTAAAVCQMLNSFE